MARPVLRVYQILNKITIKKTSNLSENQKHDLTILPRRRRLHDMQWCALPGVNCTVNGPVSSSHLGVCSQLDRGLYLEPSEAPTPVLNPQYLLSRDDKAHCQRKRAAPRNGLKASLCVTWLPDKTGGLSAAGLRLLLRKTSSCCCQAQKLYATV